MAKTNKYIILLNVVFNLIRFEAASKNQNVFNSSTKTANTSLSFLQSEKAKSFSDLFSGLIINKTNNVS